MPWQLAISFSILANVVAAQVQRRYSQRSSLPPSFPPAIAYLLGVCPIGIIVGLSLSHHVHWTWWILFLFVCNSSFIAVGNWLGFMASKHLQLVQFQLIYQFYEIVVILLGWTLLREGLSFFQVLGALLLFIAALLAIKAPVKDLGSLHRKYHFRYVAITLLGATTFGVSLIAEKAALGHMNTGAYLIFGWSAQTLAMLLLASKDANRSTLSKLSKQEIKWSASLGWIVAICGVFYIFAIVKSNNISLITAIAVIGLPLIAISAYFVLNERENQKLLWGSLCIGVLGLLVSALH